MCSVAQLCQTLCDSVDCSPPGYRIHGILQARILDSVAISYSRGSSHPRESNPRLLSLLHWQAHSLLPGKSCFIHSSVSMSIPTSQFIPPLENPYILNILLGFCHTVDFLLRLTMTRMYLGGLSSNLHCYQICM